MLSVHILRSRRCGVAGSSSVELDPSMSGAAILVVSGSRQRSRISWHWSTARRGSHRLKLGLGSAAGKTSAICNRSDRVCRTGKRPAQFGQGVDRADRWSLQDLVIDHPDLSQVSQPGTHCLLRKGRETSAYLNESHLPGLAQGQQNLGGSAAIVDPLHQRLVGSGALSGGLFHPGCTLRCPNGTTSRRREPIKKQVATRQIATSPILSRERNGRVRREWVVSNSSSCKLAAVAVPTLPVTPAGPGSSRGQVAPTTAKAAFDLAIIKLKALWACCSRRPNNPGISQRPCRTRGRHPTVLRRASPLRWRKAPKTPSGRSGDPRRGALPTQGLLRRGYP